MKNFNDGDRSRDRRDSPRRSFGGGRDRDSGRPELHDAVCDECGKDCRVPFRPSGNKPIYCSECFEKKGGRDSGRDSNRSRDRRDSPRRSFGDRDSRRPVQGGISDRSISQFVEKVETLNNKLDKIIDLLSSIGEKKSKPVKEKKSKPAKEKKPRPVKSKPAKNKKKNKKSKDIKAGEIAEVLTLVEEKETL